ncbi:MAG: hypothetical protein R3F43_13670 [bacterium]
MCNLQGRWERLPCPQGEVCVFEGTSAPLRAGSRASSWGAATRGSAATRGVVDDGQLIPGDGAGPEDRLGCR